MAGEVSLKFEVYPLTIKGLDYSKEFNFQIKEHDPNRKKLLEKLEKKDKELKIESSLFQEMIQSIAPIQQDDDEESEDEEVVENEEKNESDNADNESNKSDNEENIRKKNKNSKKSYEMKEE